MLLNFDSPPRLFGRADGQWSDWGDRLRVPAADSLATRVFQSCLVAVTADFDSDGQADLMTAGVERHIWHNLDGWLDLTIGTGLAATGPPVADAAAGDLDRDGDLDLVLLLAAGGVHVLRNESVPDRIRFSRPLPQSPSLRVRKSVSCALADLDNDGNLDLAVAQRDPKAGGRLPLFLLGAGDGTFHAPTNPTGFAAVRSLAMALWAVDCDLDGDLDLVVLNGFDVGHRPGAVVVYENLASHRGLTVVLAPVLAVPPHALGAVVTLEAGGATQRRQVRCIANPWNATVPALHFGVGEDPGPYPVTVTWPSGHRQVLELPAPGAAYRIVEGRDEPVAVRTSP